MKQENPKFPRVITGPLAGIIVQIQKEGPGPVGKSLSTPETQAREEEIHRKESAERDQGVVYIEEF
jgi:hypothetical protein